MISALFWDNTQRRVVILYRLFGTTIGPIVKGQEVPSRRFKMDRYHIQRGGSLKSGLITSYYLSILHCPCVMLLFIKIQLNTYIGLNTPYCFIL